MYKRTHKQNPTKLQQKLEELLTFYNHLSEAQLIQTLASPFKSTYFHKKSQPQFSQPVPSQQSINFANTYNYEQIFNYFSSFDQNALKSIREVILIKYSKQDDEVIRTHSTRKKLWLLMSGAWASIQEKKSMFTILNDFSNYQDYFGRIIQADVLRTIHEKDNRDQMRTRMSKILYSFARKNPYIGYCQGMNFIAAFLLQMQFNDEEVFWLLTCLLENFTPFNYYTNMMGVAVDLRIIQEIVKQKQPKIYAKLSSLGVDISIFMLEWLVCLFTSVLPFYLLVIVWDLFLMQGSVILIKTCLILLEYMSAIIMQSTQFGQFFLKLQKLKKKLYIEEIDFLRKVKAIYIDQKLLQIVRQVFQLVILIEKQSIKIQSQTNDKWKEIPCNVEWPICFHQLKKHKLDEDDIDVWVFRDQNGPNLITDYMSINKKNIKSKQEHNTQNKLVIGRIPHICDVKSYEQQQQANIRGRQLDQFDLGLRRVNKNLQKLHLSIPTQNQFFRRATSNHTFFLLPRKR